MDQHRNIIQNIGLRRYNQSIKISDEVLVHNSFPAIQIATDDVREYIGIKAAENILFERYDSPIDCCAVIKGTLYVVQDINYTVTAIRDALEEAYERGYADGSKPKLSDSNQIDGEVV